MNYKKLTQAILDTIHREEYLGKLTNEEVVFAICESQRLKMLEFNAKLDSKPTKRFTKPTIAEVQEYLTEKSYDLDAELFHDHYEANGWMVGKVKMKDWKASVRTWAKQQPKRTIKNEARKSSSASDYRTVQTSANDYFAEG